MSYQHGATIPFDLETKAVAEHDDVWRITGYASVFGNRDLGGDIVVPGAFAKSLRDHGMPMLLFNHKMNEPPIGTILECEERKKGLWIKADLPKDDTFVAGRIVPQLKKRGLKGMSIGYQTLQKEQRRDARLLKEIRLVEVSVVNQPMNPLAEVETVKSFDPAALDVVGRALEDAARELQSLTRRMRGG